MPLYATKRATPDTREKMRNNYTLIYLFFLLGISIPPAVWELRKKQGIDFFLCTPAWSHTVPRFRDESWQSAQ